MEPWVSVTDLLCIGTSPHAVIACEDADVAAGFIEDGLCVSVNDDETAIRTLENLGVEREQAERQVRWAHGQM
jgi:hypothetical protein